MVINVTDSLVKRCCRLHMNLIGINGTVKIGPPVPTDQDLQAVINQTHAMGGIVIVNHIPWSNTTGMLYTVLGRLNYHANSFCYYRGRLSSA